MSARPDFCSKLSPPHAMSVLSGLNKIILPSSLFRKVQTLGACLLCPNLLKSGYTGVIFVPVKR